MKKVKKQSGFTLVEIAIVLVIIGLLLGGVLKGQELIESSKIKSMAKDLNGFSSMYTSYQERYRTVPGDESAATTTYATTRGWTGTFAVSDSLNDGQIGAKATFALLFGPTAAALGVENLLAIQALRSAGFLEGNGTVASVPVNAAGGGIGFGHTIMGFGAGRNAVCLSGLTGKQAGAVDRLLDDGISDSGSIRSAIKDVQPPTTAAVYLEATPDFVLCKGL